MKRALTMTALLAMGLFVASSTAAAQDVPASTSGGQVSFSALNVQDVSSAKFQEYRDVPDGLSLPLANIFSRSGTINLDVQGTNVRQGDQRYNGWLKTEALDVSFDYNQIPHNMGNAGRSILSEVGPGVWAITSTLSRTLGTAADTTLPTTLRTYTFYQSLLAPTFGAANNIDVSGTRKRGSAELDFSKKLPFGLAFTYMRELKSGYRGAGGGGVYGAVASVVEVPEPLNEITQDFGVRMEHNFPAGNVHARFNRNLYNDRLDSLTIDNPFQPVDAPYTAAVGAIPALGGGARARISTPPDNEASTGNGGFMIKLARQTRIGGDVTFARLTQNAPYIPFTINSAILTPSGARADNLASLPQRSFNGKIDTTTLNVTFASRPAPGVGLRAQYRSYDLTNKTQRIVIAGHAGGNAPDRNWFASAPTAADPYGPVTANVYDTTTRRFTASASYDIGGLTLEGQGRTAKLTRTNREATSGKDYGFGFSALVHASEYVGVRGMVDRAKRTAEGHTTLGFQSDEAERETTRAGINIELTPVADVGITFAYQRRKVDYPNRPSRVAGNPATTVGLLGAKYDSYTAEIELTPGEQVEFGAYYTYEKDTSTNRWATLTAGALNNLLQYDGSDKTNTFGVNAAFQLVPEKWALSFNAMRQKVDGLMDITANSTGAFALGRQTPLLNPTGVADIGNYDDTELTNVSGQLDCVVAKAWTASVGYMYEKYDFKDAYTSGSTLMPQSVLIFMKADNGAYDANVAYAKLSYRF